MNNETRLFIDSLMRRGHSIGPGRKTGWTQIKRAINSKYRPHQGARECARRCRQKGISA